MLLLLLFVSRFFAASVIKLFVAVAAAVAAAVVHGNIQIWLCAPPNRAKRNSKDQTNSTQITKQNELKQQQQQPQRQLQQCYTNNNSTNNNLSAAHIVEPRHTCTATQTHTVFQLLHALYGIRSVAKKRSERERTKKK